MVCGVDAGVRAGSGPLIRYASGGAAGPVAG
jgi:hypothetical protein